MPFFFGVEFFFSRFLAFSVAGSPKATNPKASSTFNHVLKGGGVGLGFRV